MKIYIVGSGGIGGYFGGLLAKAKQDVTFVARGEHFIAMKKNGLLVKSVLGDFVIKPIQVIDTISEIQNPELVMFSVKTYDTDEVAKDLAKVVNQDTILLTFQNGIDNDNQIKKYIKNSFVYPGVCYIITTKTKPGIIEQTGGLRKLFFGNRTNPGDNKLKEIEKMLKKAGIDVNLSEDITRDLWKKFMFIVAFSGMTAVCRSPIGKVLNDPVSRQIYERCVREAIQVAKTMKIKINEDSFESIMRTSLNTAPSSKSSLLIDIENNRKNEIETLNGTLVRIAKKNQIDVPINQTIYSAIKLLT